MQHTESLGASAVSYMPGRFKLCFRNPASGRHKHNYYLGQNGMSVCTHMHAQRCGYHWSHMQWLVFKLD